MLNLTIFIITAVMVFLDQLTKYLVINSMNLNESVPVIPNVFHITYVGNYGAAFGILPHRTGLFVIITVAVVLLIIGFLRKLPAEYRLMRVALALQLAGAIGNLIDRLRFGFVIDFLDFRVWPVFNVADIAIVVGIGLLLFDLIRTSREEGI
ncbi:signal peptidase II [Dethiobacter alkaliphilus]|uniref:signal peptidase II n=1 Tax=Dethiobacter alkaliphilus TaxID=427926 RepID=UPI0037C1B07D